MEEIYQYVTKGRIVIKHDTYKGIDYAITTIGHPCAYIILDSNHIFTKVCEMGDFCDLVHGGITYDSVSLPPLVRMEDNKRVFGWDYNHYGDCSVLFNTDGKQWTVDEIMEDVKRMIDWIVRENMTETINLYNDFETWDNLITELSEKEIELINLKEQYLQLEQEIIETTNFKELYGKNNETIRKTHVKNELKDMVDTRNDLEISISYIKRKISFIKSMVDMKIELIKYGR